MIRIYRKEHLPVSMHRVGNGRRQHDTALCGIVEAVDRRERRAFHDIEELWAILAGTAGGKQGSQHPDTDA